MKHSDSAFTIGKTHNICQDYAINLSNEEGQAIIVCDGCSSSHLTDVGARLIALNCLDIILCRLKPLETALVGRLGSSNSYGYISKDMLDSTLLVAYTTLEDTIEVLIRGDGGLLLKYKDKEYSELFLFEYPSGYPYYLSYDIYPERKETFKLEDRGMIIKKYNMLNTECIELENEIQAESISLSYSISTNGLSYITLFSDGINSFKKEIITDTTRNTINVDPCEIVSEFISYKNYAGRFVQRRLNKFKKECNIKHINNMDDFSVATINLE
jgi:hypothetical protein